MTEPSIGYVVCKNSFRGHGFMVEKNLFLTSAHVIGNAEDAAPPDEQVDVFLAGRHFTGKLHPKGWFPICRLDGKPEACDDLAFLQLVPKDKDDTAGLPEPLAMGSLQQTTVPCEIHVVGNAPSEEGKCPDDFYPEWDDIDLKCITLKERQITLQETDDQEPRTEEGWSGSPVMTCAPRGSGIIVGMWQKSPNRKVHHGKAISSAIIKTALQYIFPKPNPLPPFGFQPHVFADKWAGYPARSIDDDPPVSAVIKLVEAERDENEVHLHCGFAPVVAIETASGTVRFGTVGAGLRLVASGLNFENTRNVTQNGAAARAEFQTYHPSRNSINYVVVPNNDGDLLSGNALANPDHGGFVAFTSISIDEQNHGRNSPPEIAGSVAPDFRVMSLSGSDGQPLPDDVVNRFKLELIEAIAKVHSVNNGHFPIPPVTLKQPDSSQDD